MKILSEEFYDLIRFAECQVECEECPLIGDGGCTVYELYKRLERLSNDGRLEKSKRP